MISLAQTLNLLAQKDKIREVVQEIALLSYSAAAPLSTINKELRQKFHGTYADSIRAMVKDKDTYLIKAKKGSYVCSFLVSKDGKKVY